MTTGALNGRAGRSGWGGSAAGKQHQKMDIKSNKPGLGIFKPRAVAVGAAAAEEANPPRSNAEFRKMLLAKGKGSGGPPAQDSAGGGNPPGGESKGASGEAKPASGARAE